jgi:hypothetical protein
MATKKQVVEMLPAAPTPQTLSPYHPMMATALEKGQIEGLERLYELQERWEDRQARDAFYAAMALFQAECPAIPKSKQGSKAKYAPLEEVEKIIKPILSKYGFSVSYDTERVDGLLTAYATVRHRQGHSEVMGRSSTQFLQASATRGGMTQTQADAGTITFLQRYVLKTALNLTFIGDDTDGELVITAEQVMQLPDLIKETPFSFGQWLAQTTTNLEQLTHLQASRMVQAIEKYLSAKTTTERDN